MNYGKKKSFKTARRMLLQKPLMKKKRAGVRLFKAMLLTCLVAIVLCVAGGGLFIKKMIDDAPDITPEDVKPSKLPHRHLPMMRQPFLILS